jgi:unsaturated rhamnogalacturonyl hydrolase
MKRRQFLTAGTAVVATPALPSVATATAAAAPSSTLPSRAEIITLVRRVSDHGACRVVALRTGAEPAALTT